MVPTGIVFPSHTLGPYPCLAGCGKTPSNGSTADAQLAQSEPFGTAWQDNSLEQMRGSSVRTGASAPQLGWVISQRKRKRVEECFGWLKTIALLRKVRHRGVLKVGWVFTFAAAAYNLVRMRNLEI